MEIRDRISNLIGNNKIKEALSLMQNHFKKTGNKNRENEVILIRSQFEKYTSDSIKGIIDDNSNELNKIRNSILELNKKIENKKEEITPKNHDLSLIFQDDFYRTTLQQLNIFTDWNTGNNVNQENYIVGKATIKNNRLVIENYTSENSTHSFKSLKINEFADYQIQANLNGIDVEADCYYGLFWGASYGRSSLYYFTINPIRGQASIRYQKDKEKHIILEDTFFDFISYESILTIRKHQDSIYYFIEDELICKSKCYSFFGDRFGPIVFGEGKVEYNFVKVYN